MIFGRDWKWTLMLGVPSFFFNYFSIFSYSLYSIFCISFKCRAYWLDNHILYGVVPPVFQVLTQPYTYYDIIDCIFWCAILKCKSSRDQFIRIYSKSKRSARSRIIWNILRWNLFSGKRNVISTCELASWLTSLLAYNLALCIQVTYFSP